MFSELNPFVKISLAVFWSAYLPLLIIAVIGTKELSLAQGLVRFLIPLSIQLAWMTRLHQYLFFGLFGEPGTGFIALIKSYLFTFFSSCFYFLLVLILVLLYQYSKLFHAIPAYYLVTSLAGISLFWALLLFQRFRIIEDTASTRLNSAAQGYTELEGTAMLYEGETARSPHQDFPVMIWYRRFFFVSAQGFLLDDGKGKCTIDPRDAEVITPFYFYNALMYNAIYPKEKIYVLGQLHTLNKHRTEWEQKGLVNGRLREWKRNRFAFLDMFDRDKNGVIDETELESAKLAAQRLISAELETKYLQPATHIIAKPDDGRPFILSSIHPDTLIKRYKVATLLHILLIIFMVLIVVVMTW
jgi:hypothetical protein